MLMAARAQAQSCAFEASLRSLNSAQATQITFINETSEIVALYWLNFHGRRVSYGVMSPGQSLPMNTFATHPWILTDGGGTCFMIVVNDRGRRTLRIQP
jgi:hypothetical protein